MPYQWNRILLATVLVQLAMTVPNYVLAYNLSIGTAVYSVSFLPDDTLVLGRSGELSFSQFNGS